MAKAYAFKKGEYGESMPWHLLVDVVIDTKYNPESALCCHAKDVVKKEGGSHGRESR